MLPLQAACPQPLSEFGQCQRKGVLVMATTGPCGCCARAAIPCHSCSSHQHQESCLHGRTHCRLGLLLQFLLDKGDGCIQQVLDDGLHIAPMVADLCEFGGLNLDERSIRQLGQASCYFCFATSSWADHQDVLWCDVMLHGCGHAVPPPPVSEGHRYCFLSILLANNVSVEALNHSSRCKFGQRFALVFKERSRKSRVLACWSKPFNRGCFDATAARLGGGAGALSGAAAAA
mmetsp:Transcript_13326/g.23456  ORF Transcript_13326/g.23456 Transcript_13326/m.23456 type:complete len:232 (+) Transcript_13326:1219-1914(+)